MLNILGTLYEKFRYGLQNFAQDLVIPNVVVAKFRWVNQKKVLKVQDMFLAHRRLKLRVFVEVISLSTGVSVFDFNCYLDIEKHPRDECCVRSQMIVVWSFVSERDTHLVRFTTSKECLTPFSRNLDKFPRRLANADGTWIHHNS